jgi:hypothetical protein
MTPDHVIAALEQVRTSAAVNMLDRKGVTARVAHSGAREWLDKASDGEYMDALTEMGEAVPADNEAEYEAEGLKLASSQGWDGFAILEICKAALTDANFHRESEILGEMIKALDEDEDARFKLTVLPSAETNSDFPGVELDPISGLPEHLFRNEDDSDDGG